MANKVLQNLKDDPSWLHQLDNSSPILNSANNQSTPFSNQTQFSIENQNQIHDQLNAYAFAPASLPPSTLPPVPTNLSKQGALSVDPLVFNPSNFSSPSAFSTVRAQQARRATVSLSSPQFNRLRFHPNQSAWSGPSDYASHKLINSPVTRQDAHPNFETWVPGTNLHPNFTIPEEPEALSDGILQALPQVNFDHSSSYSQPPIDTRFRSSSLSFLDGIFPTVRSVNCEAEVGEYETANSLAPAPDHSDFQSSSSFSQTLGNPIEYHASDWVTPPYHLEPSPSDSPNQAPQTDSTLGLYPSTELSHTEMPRSRPSPPGQSDPNGSVVGLEASVLASDDLDLSLPLFELPVTSSQTGFQNKQSSHNWNLDETSMPPLLHKPQTRLNRGFSFTYGCIPNGNWEAAESIRNTDQFTWDRDSLASLQSVMPLGTAIEPRRESDPSPAAPLPQRPWEQRHRYSISHMPSAVSNASFNKLDSAPYLGYAPDLDFEKLSRSRQSPSFSTQASQPTSAGPNTAATSVFNEGLLEQWHQSDCTPSHPTQHPFSLSAIGASQYAILPPGLCQTSSKLTLTNLEQARLPSKSTSPREHSRGPSDHLLNHSQGKKRERSLSIVCQAPPSRYGAYDEPSRFGGLGQGPSPYPPGLNQGVKPKEEDFSGETGEDMIPWQQDLRCDEDLYTPMWCRGQNDKKEGFCDMCEGGAWLRLKNSAFWYHKQYHHGVSSTTGHYFYPPRETKRGLSSANRQQVLGLCHECNEWVGYSTIPGSSRQAAQSQASEEASGSASGAQNVAARGEDEKEECDELVDEESPKGSEKEKADEKVPTLWYKHAHKCHRHQTCKGAKGRKKSKKNVIGPGKVSGSTKAVS
ncbi:hypothetical protein DFH28DRAFT_511232 [Melampsora americana]|nr:hypothetical protein DFH28DRAFT_511232 [Melampsora americana]